MIKRYVKQKIKHKMKQYSTRVSVRQVEEQHSETKRLVKRKKENRNTSFGPIFIIGAFHHSPCSVFRSKFTTYIYIKTLVSIN